MEPATDTNARSGILVPGVLDPESQTENTQVEWIKRTRAHNERKAPRPLSRAPTASLKQPGGSARRVSQAPAINSTQPGSGGAGTLTASRAPVANSKQPGGSTRPVSRPQAANSTQTVGQRVPSQQPQKPASQTTVDNYGQPISTSTTTPSLLSFFSSSTQTVPPAQPAEPQLPVQPEQTDFVNVRNPILTTQAATSALQISASSTAPTARTFPSGSSVVVNQPGSVASRKPVDFSTEPKPRQSQPDTVQSKLNRVVEKMTSPPGTRYDLKTTSKIAEGAYGYVFLLNLGASEFIPAVCKIINPTAKNPPKLATEHQIARSIKSPYVVAVADSMPTVKYNASKVPALVAEYCNLGTLFAVLDKQPTLTYGGHLEWVYRIAGCVFLGLESIHNAGYIHGDLWASNVILHDPTEARPSSLNMAVAKISDFGTALPIATASKERFVAAGPGAQAPEMWQSRQQARSDYQNYVEPKIDIWAFGMLVLQAWNLKKLDTLLPGDSFQMQFNDNPLIWKQKLENLFTTKLFENTAKTMPKDMRECILGCLQLKPTGRYNREALKRSSFIRSALDKLASFVAGASSTADANAKRNGVLDDSDTSGNPALRPEGTLQVFGIDCTNATTGEFAWFPIWHRSSAQNRSDMWAQVMTTVESKWKPATATTTTPPLIFVAGYGQVANGGELVTALQKQSNPTAVQMAVLWYDATPIEVIPRAMQTHLTIAETDPAYETIFMAPWLLEAYRAQAQRIATAWRDCIGLAVFPDDFEKTWDSVLPRWTLNAAANDAAQTAPTIRQFLLKYATLVEPHVTQGLRRIQLVNQTL